MTSAAAPERPSTLTAILAGGIVAGTIDIGAAALINMATPVRILHFVAGGLYGRAALQGGAAMAILGGVLQLAMSIVIAAVYVFASRHLPILRRAWLASGLLYGVVVFFVMNYIVVPLSAWGKTPAFSVASFVENMLAMLLFGLIIAFFAQRTQWAS
jgi:hypothetical protein